MKKLSILVLLIVLATTGCSKDNSVYYQEQIIGTWFRTNDYADEDQTRTVEWNFNADGTMEISYLEFQRSTGDFLGYSVLQLGKFKFVDGIVYFNEQKGYSYSFDGDTWLEDAEYVADKESFFERRGDEFETFRASISIRKFNSELVLDYLDCNDIGNCVGSETLTRH